MGDIAGGSIHGKEQRPQQERQEQEEGGGSQHEATQADSFLIELNLLLVGLSVLSSEEDSVENHVTEVERVENQGKAMACISRLRDKRYDLHEPSHIPSQRAQRVQPMIKDCRHGRRM